ncbi:hypothetical protein [Luteibacter sp. CQ10]|uniref:hypothetical protein n=1 Tax=Luteibacter sp. CQ10 TaxID=2805821 RepID=UPI0034A34F73
MTLHRKHLGAGLGGLGALGIAPYLSGMAILLSLGLPFDELRFGLAWAYWQAIDLPAFAAHAGRIRWAGGIGLVAAPLAWAAIVGTAWWRGYRVRPPRVPLFARMSALKTVWPRASSGRLPSDASLLIVAPDYPRAFAALLPALRDQAGPMLVVDIEGKLHDAAAAWRAGHGPVQRIAPFGGGMPWNPLAAMCHDHGVHREAVTSLVASWYPGGTPFITSLIELAFRALLGVVNDTLRHAGDPATPAPGDLARLARLPLNHATLDRLAVIPGLTPDTRADLTAWRRVDDDALALVAQQLRPPLARFLDPVLDAHTRGPSRPLQGTVFLTVPYAHRAEVVPLLHALLWPWRQAPTLVVHGLDLLPVLPPVRRCLATAVSMQGLLAMHGKNAEVFARRFRFVAWHGPGRGSGLAEDIDALGTYLTAHGHYGERLTTDTYRAALRRLRTGKQAVFSPLLWPPVRCPVVTAPSRHPTTPRSSHEGEPMTLPTPIAALLASLAVATATPAEAAPTARLAAATTPTVPTHVVKLGPHRFRLPVNVFNGPEGFSYKGIEFGIALRWPTLEPYPLGVNFHDDNDDFISSVRIIVSYFERLSDEEASNFLLHHLRYGKEASPYIRNNPAHNLDMRIRGEPRFGLTPYYLDTQRLKAYYTKEFGPNSKAVIHVNEWGEDWFLRRGKDGVPLTFVTCSTRLRPDGVTVTGQRLVDGKPGEHRAVCTHEFLLPQYKTMVSADYLRVMLPDWKKIEARVADILRDAEVTE